MEKLIRRENFSSEFNSRFNDEDFSIIVDFCNSFCNRYGKYLPKEEIIKRMSTLEEIRLGDSKDNNEIASHRQTVIESKKIQRQYIQCNKEKYVPLSTEEKKATLYHELIHHLSSYEREEKDAHLGMDNPPFTEVSGLDEIFTEFYATQLLRDERNKN